jgi:hypothetical protein
MTNPFDQVINVEDEKQQEVKVETKVKEDRKKPEKEHIQLTINKKTIERSAFIAAIVILALLVYLNPFCACGVKDGEMNSVTGAVVAAPGEDTIEEKAEIKVVENKADEEEEKVKEEKKEEEEEIEKPFRTNFDFMIDEINYDRNEDNKPSRMKSIQFTMRNRWKNFKPRIEVHWYDDDSKDAFEDKKRAVKLYGIIKEGQSLTYKIVDFDSTFFYPEDDEEIIVLKLYNAENDLLMTTATKKIP